MKLAAMQVGLSTLDFPRIQATSCINKRTKIFILFCKYSTFIDVFMDNLLRFYQFESQN